MASSENRRWSTEELKVNNKVNNCESHSSPFQSQGQTLGITKKSKNVEKSRERGPLPGKAEGHPSTHMEGRKIL